MNAINPKVDFYFAKAKTWKRELEELRTIILNCNLTEELKWGVPCYVFQNSNIVLIHDFKEYCAVLFFKGVLLNDSQGILVQQTKNVQSARQIRFINLQQIIEMRTTLKSYIFEAIEIDKAGLKVDFKETKELNIPEEFQSKLDKNLVLKNAFDALTPGRKRGYLLYFSAAKQSKTRLSRVEKSIPQIFLGKGLND